MFCRLKVRSYVLAANVAGTLKVAPLQILKFPVVLPHKFLDAEKFNLRFSDASEITEIADKLRWLRYQKGLRQRDVADYAGIDRSTYVHYEEYGKDLYPPEHMEKIAQLFEVPVETLLDDYNLFLRNGQGNQIKAIRTKLGLTQRQYADKLGVSLGNLKHWEQNRKQIFSNPHGRSISSRRKHSKTSRPAVEAGLLVCYVLLLRFQMLHGGVYQLQLLLRGAGQLLDGFQRLLGLELCQLLPKLLLRLL